jgi:hypothetical protein
MQQREVIRSANAEKRQERQDKNEAIRVKYGKRGGRGGFSFNEYLYL